MYNFLLAFIICTAVYLIGEAVSNLTKAWVPSVFVTAVILLVGFWTVIPKTVIADTMMLPFASSVGIYLLLVHLGTVISLKQLKEQWKTVVVCLVGLAGMCVLALLILPGIIGREFVISGLPPLTGGIVAAMTMQEAAMKAGMQEVAVFAIAMYCVQGFAGYPLTAVCLQLEGKRLLKDYHSQGGATGFANNTADENGKLAEKEAEHKRLIPELPASWNTPPMILFRLAVVGWLASMMGGVVIPIINMKISGVVWALVFGIIATAIGFLDSNSLTKANSFGILMFALMMYVFDGLKDCTPEMLKDILVPMILLIVVGVIGMALFVFVISKILKIHFLMAFATGLTALYGFPPNAIITEKTCDALAKTPEEKEYLMSQMFPPMIVGGFVTVTITSVIIAGVFVSIF